MWFLRWAGQDRGTEPVSCSNPDCRKMGCSTEPKPNPKGGK